MKNISKYSASIVNENIIILKKRENIFENSKILFENGLI